MLAFLTRAGRRAREKSGRCAKGRNPLEPPSGRYEGQGMPDRQIGG